MTAEFDAPVGIVGAGPVGLVLAARLAQFGVRSIVLEADPHLVKRGSKACLIQGDVLEVLDKFGVGDAIAEEGVVWRVGHTYIRDKEIRTEHYPDRPGFGPFVNISQFRIEQIVADVVEADPNCRLEWNHSVIGVDQDEDGVTARTRAGEAKQSFRFRYLIACDGVRSELREMVGARWTGYSHGDRFLITDIRARLPLVKERHFHYDPSSNRGRQLVMHPQPDDIWRIDWQLPPEADIDRERESGAFDRRVRAVIGDVPYEVDWVSTYRFHQRVVDRMRVGRVMLAGDAAHALPPYGARGMNSGIQDVDNLAWKLAAVLDARAEETLLDTYHDERHAAAEENLRITEATIRFMVPPSRVRRAARSVLLQLAGPFRQMRKHVNSGRMAEPFVYADSPIVARTHPLVGSLAPDAKLPETDDPPPGADDPRRLRHLFGEGFVCLYFCADTGDASAFAKGATALDVPVPVNTVLVLPASHTDPESDDVELPDGVKAVRDAHGDLLAAYAGLTSAWWLIRPDGHIAAHGTEPADVEPAVAAATGAVRSASDDTPRKQVFT
ncbi:MAG: FAD-dependent monooxygenase [Spirillospora sp.]